MLPLKRQRKNNLKRRLDQMFYGIRILVAESLRLIRISRAARFMNQPQFPQKPGQQTEP
jgi:hypothetical protein